MENYKKYQQFELGTKCCVDGCANPAEYEVILYDYYSTHNDTFYEQDFTCPFLCGHHMEENEKNAKGERKPRGTVKYPYTNKHIAQGYTKYNPLKEVYPQLFSSGEIENNKDLQIDLNEVNEELIAHLAKHPEYMRQMDSRKFELLIADIFKRKGYDVTLTPKTRDGGKDIIALYKSPFGHQLFIVECKKYRENLKVGVEIVRGLYGVKVAENYNQAILVTTSTFSKPAKDFVRPLKFQLQLKDYNDIRQWCEDYSSSN
jgi:restriction endonuclease Mrr